MGVACANLRLLRVYCRRLLEAIASRLEAITTRSKDATRVEAVSAAASICENRPGTARNGIWSMRVLGAPVSGREM